MIHGDLANFFTFSFSKPAKFKDELFLVPEFLKAPLDDYLSKLSVPTRVIRSHSRVGLIKARMLGAREAHGEILVFLDAHCECTQGKIVNYVNKDL